jgi:hypothetical protein
MINYLLKNFLNVINSKKTFFFKSIGIGIEYRGLGIGIVSVFDWSIGIGIGYRVSVKSWYRTSLIDTYLYFHNLVNVN